MLRLRKGIKREGVRRALLRGPQDTFTYTGILDGEAIRETVAGVQAAGVPEGARPLLAWLASHPNAPEDVLRELQKQGSREVLFSLCMNHRLPADLRKALLNHADREVRDHAHHVFSRTRKH